MQHNSSTQFWIHRKKNNFSFCISLHQYSPSPQENLNWPHKTNICTHSGNFYPSIGPWITIHSQSSLVFIERTHQNYYCWTNPRFARARFVLTNGPWSGFKERIWDFTEIITIYIQKQCNLCLEHKPQRVRRNTILVQIGLNYSSGKNLLP